MQRDVELAVVEVFLWVIAQKLIRPLIPDHYRAAAVFPLGMVPSKSLYSTG
jgi:hypothetical protein